MKEGGISFPCRISPVNGSRKRRKKAIRASYVWKIISAINVFFTKLSVGCVNIKWNSRNLGPIFETSPMQDVCV